MLKKKSKKEHRPDQVIDIWPQVVKGSHLTVITHQNGKTELIWDDEALLNDVKVAMANVSEVKPKRKGKKA